MAARPRSALPCGPTRSAWLRSVRTLVRRMLVDEVATSLGAASREEVTDELRELDPLKYCRSALRRHRADPKGQADLGSVVVMDSGLRVLSDQPLLDLACGPAGRVGPGRPPGL